jgi:2-amino-4-hydroxy-6-hydroxymethyldihydropteridine diphosphokinase
MDSQPLALSRTLPSDEHQVCLGLGSNFEAAANFRRAIRRIRRAITLEAISTAWQSPAVGVSAPDYINAAILARTPKSKEKLLAELKTIENELGRVREHGSSTLVTIDIDLLIFDHEPIKDDLWTEAYRAAPVAELLPDARSPSTGETVADAAKRLAGSWPITSRPEIFRRARHVRTSCTNPPSHNRTRTS